jgi:hypothetical protein
MNEFFQRVEVRLDLGKDPAVKARLMSPPKGLQRRIGSSWLYWFQGAHESAPAAAWQAVRQHTMMLCGLFDGTGVAAGFSSLQCGDMRDQGSRLFSEITDREAAVSEALYGSFPLLQRTD